MKKFPVKHFFDLLGKKSSGIIDFALSTYIDNGKDFDLIIVLRSNTHGALIDLERYSAILNILKDTATTFERETNIDLIFFTSHRLQNYFGELHKKSTGDNSFKIHLLVYPSSSHLICWEPTSIVLSLISNYTNFIGRKETLNSIKSNVSQEDISKRIQPLLQLLNETFINLALNKDASRDEKRITLKDSIEKLNYVKKFLLWELIYEETKNIPSSNFSTIVAEAKNIKKLDCFTKSLMETYGISSDNLSRRQILKLYDFFINLISSNTNLLTQKKQ